MYEMKCKNASYYGRNQLKQGKHNHLGFKNANVQCFLNCVSLWTVTKFTCKSIHEVTVVAGAAFLYDLVLGNIDTACF